MTEDRGAFKTKSLFHHRIRPFCDGANTPFFTGAGRSARFLRERPALPRVTSVTCGGEVTGAFRFQTGNRFNERRKTVALFLGKHDSLLLARGKSAPPTALFIARVPAGGFVNKRPMATSDFSGHRVPIRPVFVRFPRAMLPGFRFLFAAIMLSMSFLVFGLGAAALLRAAHESFASNSSWRGAPEVAFAQPPQTTLPMLATLSVEPATEKPASPAKADPAVIATPPDEPATPAIAAARPEPALAVAEPAKADQIAAAKPVEAPVEAVKPNNASVDMPASQPADLPVTQIPPAPEATPAAPVAGEPAVAAKETKTAAVDTLSASEPAVVQREPAAPPPSNPTTIAAEPAPPATVAGAASAGLDAPTASAAPVAPVTPAVTAETSEAETKIATLGGPAVEVNDSESALPTRAVKLPRARPDESLIKKRQQARRARRRRLAARARLLAQQQQLQANPFAQQPVAQPQQPYLQPAATTRQRQ